MSDKKVYKKVCKRCKDEFDTEVCQKQICEQCRREEKFAGCNKPTRSRNGVFESLSVMEMARLINYYNFENSANYSYGQFMLQVYLGKISLKKEVNNARNHTQKEQPLFYAANTLPQGDSGDSGLSQTTAGSK